MGVGSRANLASIFSGDACIAVSAIGVTMVIINREIDLAIGALIRVLAVISGALAVSDALVWMAWVVSICR
ncbi:hypothetical protein GCM10010873_32230 [Cypionkella aquatica]|uniref:Uncharacterized protein n=1 Tax=Cypionkella aquatica TaxID=1756042 RepID=A0AA37X2I7_9RHOB|nr:hypothetical protein GCM10010873_32230 [Cypionkella aquatica]